MLFLVFAFVWSDRAFTIFDINITTFPLSKPCATYLIDRACSPCVSPFSFDEIRRAMRAASFIFRARNTTWSLNDYDTKTKRVILANSTSVCLLYRVTRTKSHLCQLNRTRAFRWRTLLVKREKIYAIYLVIFFIGMRR